MATNLLKEVLGVRHLLDGPMDQSPSFDEIVDELAIEYQHVTNELNNTGNAWQVNTTTITTVAEQEDYQILAQDFYKALLVTTVPQSSGTHPEYVLEFTEAEHIPKDWAWLSSGKGQYMYSSHDSQIIAFYRKIGTNGEELWVKLRPVPGQAQNYKILYQQTDWWDTVFATGGISGVEDFVPPHSSQRYYIRAVAAHNLLMSGRVKWSFDEIRNFSKSQQSQRGLESRISRYRQAYEEYKSSLDNPDITWIEPWSDNILQDG